MRVIAGIQLAVLQARPRTAAGTAVKTRKRKKLARPRMCRQQRTHPGPKRKPEAPCTVAPKKRRIEAQVPLDQVLHGGSLTHSNAGALLSRYWQSAPSAPPWHDLHLEGPILPAAMVTTKNGVIFARWKCRICSKSAANSSLALKLARSSCAGPVVLEQTRHVLAPVGEGWKCTRCGLECDAGHRASTADRTCKVPRVRGATAEADEEDTRHWRCVLGYFRTHREWVASATAVEDDSRSVGVTHPPAVVPTEPGVTDAPDPLARLRPCRSHRVVWRGAIPLCVWCGQGPQRKERARFWLRGNCPGPCEPASLSQMVRHSLTRVLEADGSFPERLRQLKSSV